MKVEDTVMSEEQLEKIEKDYLNEDYSVNAIRLNRGHTEDLRLRIAQAQAEITANLLYPVVFEEGRKAEMREMVKWLESGVVERAFLIAKAALPMYGDEKEWARNSANVLRQAVQAKFKELGVNDDY